MEKVLVNQKPAQKQSENNVQRTEQQSQENDFSIVFKTNSLWPRSEGGFNLAQIPARPALHTHQQIQCFTKDGAVPKGQDGEKQNVVEGGEGDQTEQSTVEDQSEPGVVEPGVVEPGSPEQNPAENKQATPGEEPVAEPEAATSKLQASGSLIVEDSVKDPSEGQMKKTEFLQKLRSSICDTIGPVLATVGQTTEGCPYLNYWLGLYQEKDAAEVERTAKKYAPGVARASTAEEYISIITQRALGAAVIWARTGKITGVPDGVPTTVPGESPAEHSKEEYPVQAKAKNGGLKKADDPKAIKKDLGDGQPLSSDLRSRMESAFGLSFSNVRAHTDSTASRLSDKVNARAFTVGKHIAFGNGEYQPGTLMGDALIAHELAHTIQQNGAENLVDKLEAGTSGYDSLEKDADNTAIGIVSSLWANRKNVLGGMIQRSLPVLRSGLKIQRCPGSKNSAKTTTPSPQANDPCPTSVVLDKVQDLTPGGLALGYNTGYGIVSTMHLLPDSKDWSSALVYEDVSQKTSTCPDVWKNMCTPTDKPFPINKEKYSTVLKTMPAEKNRFYDFHTSRWNGSRLHDKTQNPSGMDECMVVCNQSYRCDKRVLGHFQVTRTFKKDKFNGRDVTKVTAEKIQLK